MKTRMSKLLVTLGMCAGILFFTNCVKAANESEQVAQELVSGLGIPADVADSIANGPGDTFGQRLQDALHNGTLNQHQYNTITNRFLALPDEKRWAIKGAYDAGQGIPERVLHPGQPQGDASLKQHIADLKGQGFTRDQIVERLRNEGVSPDHLKDLGYVPAASPAQMDDASLKQHVQDLKAQGFTGDQIAERLRNEGVRPNHLKDLGYGPQENSRRDIIKGATMDHRKDRRDQAREHRDDIKREPRSERAKDLRGPINRENRPAPAARQRR